MNEHVHFKREAIRIRRRIEDMASHLWSAATALDRSAMAANHVERRLVLVVAHVPDDMRLVAFRAARKAGHAYRETSDVLHGRFAAAHFKASRVSEWDSDVDRLAALLGGCTPRDRAAAE